MLLERDTFRRLCRARDMLTTIEEERRSIPEIAREAEISTFHFIRVFEALFGLTPHQLRIRERLEYAKRLLAETDRSVTDVCMEVGFSSLGSFSDLFKRRIGVTPTEYRRRVRPCVNGCFSLMAQFPRSTRLGTLGESAHENQAE